MLVAREISRFVLVLAVGAFATSSPARLRVDFDCGRRIASTGGLTTPVHMAVADFDRDGHADVVTILGEPGARRFAFFPSEGPGVFGASVESLSVRDPVAFAVGSAGVGHERRVVLGFTCLPTPLRPSRQPQPRHIANNLGFASRLGAERWPGPPTSPAPTLLLDLGSGVGRPARFFLQGLMRDAAGPNGVAAVTNGVEIVIP